MPVIGEAAWTNARRLQWRTPWHTQADFYVDGTGDDKRVIAVFCGSDLWNTERFHPHIDRDFDTRPLLKGYCCGTSFETRGYPCSNCQQPFCPHCENCRCEQDAKREVTCTKCFLKFLPHLVVDGQCVECRS